MNPKLTSSKVRPQLHPRDFGPHWNSCYYDSIQEIYWDARNMLGKISPDPLIFANDREMLGNLRRLEVSLNHILALFFSLAPQDFTSDLERQVFSDSCDQPFRNVDIFELRRNAPHDPTQPDVFLVSNDTCLSIEVKIGSKSYLEQAVKYALLHCDYEKRTGPKLASRLIFLTPRSVSKTWKENFHDIASMREALEHFDYPALLKKTKLIALVSSDELRSAANAMEIGHITFDQLNEFTKGYAASIPPEALYADTVKKLFDGLLHEFEFRRDLLNLCVK